MNTPEVIRPPPALRIEHTDNPAVVYLASLSSEVSRRTARVKLAMVARLFNYDWHDMPWTTLTFRETVAIRARLIQRGYQPGTINTMLVAMRGTLRAAWRLGQIDTDHYMRAIDVKNISFAGDSTFVRPGRTLRYDEIERLVASCRGSSCELDTHRDLAILSCLRVGLRRDEIAHMLGRYVQTEDNKDAATWVSVEGKGRKHREVPVPAPWAQRLVFWRDIQNAPEDLLFGPYGYDKVKKVLHLRSQQAGLHKLTAHDFRRTMCTELLDAGVDLLTVGKLLGHANPGTTKIYDRRDRGALFDAVRYLKAEA